MLGDLYIVTNDINNKIYIGKTYIGYKNRWKSHLNDAYRVDRDNNNKFYNALLKYGPEHFHIGLINQFEEGILEQKEIEYIAKYDSYHNGYNSTIGGDGYKIVNIDSELVISLFKDGVSIGKISKEYGYTARQVSKIIKDNNIDVQRQTTCKLEQYDKNGNILRTFESKREAFDWLKEHYRENMKACTAYYYIKKASENNGIAFGYKWKQYETDIVKEKTKQYGDYNKYYCNAWNDTEEVIFNNMSISEVAKIIHRDIKRDTHIDTIKSTIINSNHNRIYGLFWEVYKQDI